MWYNEGVKMQETEEYLIGGLFIPMDKLEELALSTSDIELERLLFCCHKVTYNCYHVSGYYNFELHGGVHIWA